MFLTNTLKKSLKGMTVGLALAMTLTGCGSGSSGGGLNPVIDGVTGPNVTFLNNQFLMTLVINNVTVDGGLRLPIPHMPNSYLEVGPDLQSNGLLISVGLDVNDIAALTHGAINLLPPQDLPGGRPLPGIVNGQIPAIAIQVPKWDNMVFYVGPSVFGVFVPVKLPFQNYIGTFRFFDTKGNDVGNISIVGTDTSGKNSGILVLIPIQGQVANLIPGAN